jgi:hypothetical protein
MKLVTKLATLKGGFFVICLLFICLVNKDIFDILHALYLQKG